MTSQQGAPKAHAGPLVYFLRLRLKEEAIDVFTDPQVGGDFLKKVETLPGNLEKIRSRGAWGPSAVYNSEDKEWCHLVFTFGDVVPILLKHIQNFPEVTQAHLEPTSDQSIRSYQKSTGEDHTEREDDEIKEGAILIIRGIDPPRDYVIPKGFQPWTRT